MSRGTFIVRLIAIAALLLLAVWLYSLLSSTHSSSEVATTDQIDEPLSATFAVPLEAAQPSHKLPEKRIVPDEMPQEPLTEKIISGSLTISGNVLNAVGDSLPNIEIIATPPRRFANAAVQNVIETTSRSDSSGHYHLDGLKPGDYQIRTVETGLYPSATISARAGTEQADLQLSAYQSLWVYGVVKDGNQALAGVQVTPSGDPLNATFSNSAGEYGLHLTLKTNPMAQDILHFSLSEYVDKRVALHAIEPDSNEHAMPDVNMLRISDRAVVRGTIMADEQPVSGARVVLRSTAHSHNYQASSDSNGEFIWLDVVTGEYTLNVVPGGLLQDYTEPQLQVSGAGRELKVELSPLENARLQGQMTDINGEPIADFSLWLTSLNARGQGSRSLQGDAHGFFDVKNIAAGELRLITHSVPRLQITGANVDVHNTSPMQLILDVGDYQFAGRVTNANNNPVPGAQVSLLWSHEYNGLISHSVRNATSDTNGNFRFSQLGSGVHSLKVSASGYRPVHIDQDVSLSNNMLIELTALSP